MSFSLAKRQEVIDSLNKLLEAGEDKSTFASKLGISDATVNRYLKDIGVEFEKKWSKNHGVVDGKKFCSICKCLLPVEKFYKRKDGGLYSYCKEDDKKRAVVCGQRRREILRRRRKKIQAQIEINNRAVRSLLAKTRDFIFDLRGHCFMVDEIDEFFMHEKNFAKLKEV